MEHPAKKQKQKRKRTAKQMNYNEREIELMEKLDAMYMATIRAHLKYQTDFTKGQVSGAELAYLALALAPSTFVWADVDDIFRGE